MTIDAALLAQDLITRTEAAVESVARLAVETGVTFTVGDIVDAVERALPTGYPSPTKGEVTRRDTIEQTALAILSGEMYED